MIKNWRIWLFIAGGALLTLAVWRFWPEARERMWLESLPPRAFGSKCKEPAYRFLPNGEKVLWYPGFGFNGEAPEKHVGDFHCEWDGPFQSGDKKWWRQQIQTFHVDPLANGKDPSPLQKACKDHGITSDCDASFSRACGAGNVMSPCGLTGKKNGCAICMTTLQVDQYPP